MAKHLGCLREESDFAVSLLIPRMSLLRGFPFNQLLLAKSQQHFPHFTLTQSRRCHCPCPREPGSDGSQLVLVLEGGSGMENTALGNTGVCSM